MVVTEVWLLSKCVGAGAAKVPKSLPLSFTHSIAQSSIPSRTNTAQERPMVSQLHISRLYVTMQGTSVPDDAETMHWQNYTAELDF